MPEKSDPQNPVQAVAPGYPAIEALKNIDVSGWEPAAVFTPVELPDSSPTEDKR